MITGERVGRGARGSRYVRAFRPCHQSLFGPGPRNPEGQGLCVHQLCGPHRCGSCLRKDGWMYVLPVSSGYSEGSTDIFQLVIVTLSSASSLRRGLLRLLVSFRFVSSYETLCDLFMDGDFLCTYGRFMMVAISNVLLLSPKAVVHSICALLFLRA